MDSDNRIVAQGVSDSEDRLIHATEILLELQLACGGEVPGTIAISELRELVRNVRGSRLAYTGPIKVLQDCNEITLHLAIVPNVQQGGCTVSVFAKHVIPTSNFIFEQTVRDVIDRHLAELLAYLDNQQRLLFAQAFSADMEELASQMRAGLGHHWTDYISLNDSVEVSEDWQSADGMALHVEGGLRDCRIRLIPQLEDTRALSGFELLIVPDQANAVTERDQKGSQVHAARSFIGQDLAPVLSKPIARIVSNAAMIKARLGGPIAEVYAEHAGEISSAGNLLIGLLEDLVDLEEIDADDFEAARDHIDLAAVSHQAVGILSSRAQERQITVSLPTGLQLNAIGDFRRALQIILNLVGNAVRYSPTGSLIKIDFVYLGASVRVVVADQGPGLSLDEQERVFQKFERLGRSGDGGSGLGLYISRKLAWAMGGSLYVESRAGHGARFIFELPSDPNI